MKFVAVGICIGTLLLAGAAFAQTPASPDVPQSTASGPGSVPMSPNEAAGLPDLKSINRPAGTASSTVELNTVREPSYHRRERDGTEITEYRDRGKPTEIDVRSNFGTHYQMSAPTDTTPRVPVNSAPTGRVPSIRLSY